MVVFFKKHVFKIIILITTVVAVLNHLQFIAPISNDTFFGLVLAAMFGELLRFEYKFGKIEEKLDNIEDKLD